MTGIRTLKQPKPLPKFVTEVDINKVSFPSDADDFPTRRDQLLFLLSCLWMALFLPRRGRLA